VAGFPVEPVDKDVGALHPEGKGSGNQGNGVGQQGPANAGPEPGLHPHNSGAVVAPDHGHKEAEGGGECLVDQVQEVDQDQVQAQEGAALGKLIKKDLVGKKSCQEGEHCAGDQRIGVEVLGIQNPGGQEEGPERQTAEDDPAFFHTVPD